jgi:hypothetical protein
VLIAWSAVNAASGQVAATPPAPPARQDTTQHDTTRFDSVLIVERTADRPGRERVVRALASRKIELRGEDLTAHEIARRFAIASGETVNFVVISKVEHEDLPTTSLDLPALPVLSAMGVVQRMTGLRFVYRSGLVQLKPADEVRELAVLRMYDVTAAVAPLRDRPGPKLSLATPGDEDPPEPADTDKTLSGFTIERLLEMIQNNVAPDSWETPGVTLSTLGGVLLVRQSEQNHRKIALFLIKLGVLTPSVDRRTSRVRSAERRRR